eukprot:EG_transcript_21039
MPDFLKDKACKLSNWPPKEGLPAFRESLAGVETSLLSTVVPQGRGRASQPPEGWLAPAPSHFPQVPIFSLCCAVVGGRGQSPLNRISFTHTLLSIFKVWCPSQTPKTQGLLGILLVEAEKCRFTFYILKKNLQKAF